MIAALARRAICEAEETFHFYVDPIAGSDVTGNHTRALPYQSLAKALTELAPGQGIGLKDDTFSRSSTVFTVQAQRARIGRYGKGTNKPVVSGGKLVTGWTQQLTSPYKQRTASFNDATGTSHVAPVAVAASAGNTVIAEVKCSAGAAITAVTDSKGNTWVVDRKSANVSGATVAVCRSVLTTGLTTSDTITFTSSVSCSTGIGAFEYTGTLTPDVGAAASGSSATAAAGPVTTTSANEIVLFAVASGNSMVGSTPPVGYTERDSGQKTQAVDLAELVVSATGTFTPSWTITSGAWAAAVQTYTMSGGGSSNIYAAALTSATSFVTSTAGSTITGLTQGSSPTALTANQWYWSANQLYVNLGGTDPSTTTIEAAVQAALFANLKDGVVARGVAFRHGYDHLVDLPSCNYPRLDRCELEYCGYVSNSGTLRLGWSASSPSVAAARVSRCLFDHLMNDGAWWSGMPGIEIDHNTFRRVGYLAGDVQSDALQVYLGFGSCAGFDVHDNVIDLTGTFSPKGHFAFEGNPGQDLQGAMFRNNHCIGGGYLIGGNASNAKVFGNTVTDVIAGGGGLQVDATGGTSTNLWIYDNLIVRCAGAGLYVASGGPALVGFILANNTVIDCTGIPVNVQPASLDATSIVANNLIWNPNAGPGANMVKAWPTTGSLPAGWDHNLYPADRANGYQFKGTNYATLAAWLAATGADAHSLQGQDPLLDANYRPLPGSPALGAGLVIPGITVGATADIGYSG